MTSSPSDTSGGVRFPVSSLPSPSPTASTLPRWGFSLAVSGRTMPLAVVSSSSTAWTISRSPSGLSFIGVTSVRPVSEFRLGTLPSRVPSANGNLALVLGRRAGREALRDLLGPLEDRREADDRDDVVLRDLAAVDLLEEVHGLLEAAELRVVVLDVPRRELPHPLDLDGVDHRLEDLLARRVLEAHGDQDHVPLAVLGALVAEADRRGLAPALELIDEHRRVEVQDVHGGRRLSACAQRGKGGLGHLALAPIAQEAGRILERNPLRRVDLEVVIAHAARAVAEEEEAHDLHHPVAVAAVPVLHVAELLDQPAVDPGLLAQLAGGGVGGALAGVDVALGQGEDPPVLHPHGGQELASPEPPQRQTSRRELADHSSAPSPASVSSAPSGRSETSGPKRTGTTGSRRPSRKRISSSLWSWRTR